MLCFIQIILYFWYVNWHVDWHGPLVDLMLTNIDQDLVNIIIDWQWADISTDGCLQYTIKIQEIYD